MSGREFRLMRPSMQLASDPRWRAIQARMRPGDRVLDAGCGLGDWVEFLAEQGMFATGLDYSEGLVRMQRVARPDLSWVQGDIRQIPLPDASLDGVVSWGVVEHDEAGPHAALREFHRILRPGGWLFVTVPIDGPDQRASSDLQFGDQRDGTFFQYYFTRAELAEVTAQAGFDVNLVAPTGTHFAVKLPRTYQAVSRSPRLVRSVATHALNAYYRIRGTSPSMYMAVARKN